jgi:3-oxoacyl-[acyl-carrier protein] reductase
MKDEDWENVININLNANFFINRDVLKKMFKKKYGKVINISSIVASMGNFGQSNYCASKAGLEAMSKSLTAEFAGRNININCIAPGFIDTEMTQKMPEDIKNKMLQLIPAKRYGNPIEIAKIVIFLASDDSSYINGQVIHANGGMLMK